MTLPLFTFFYPPNFLSDLFENYQTVHHFIWRAGKTPKPKEQTRPECNRDLYMDVIEALPLVNTPDVFGLHPNAEIGYYTTAAKGTFLHKSFIMHTAFAIIGVECNF